MEEKANTHRRLDKKDMVLLALLQGNGELSLTEIGNRVGLSKMAISNRIRNLKNAGVLEGSYYKVNPERVGQEYLIVTQAECEVSGPEQLKIASQIAKVPGVQTVYLTFGPYDILFIARRKDMKSARDLLYEVTHIHGIRNTQSTIPHTIIKESLNVSLES